MAVPSLRCAARVCVFLLGLLGAAPPILAQAVSRPIIDEAPFRIEVVRSGELEPLSGALIEAGPQTVRLIIDDPDIVILSAVIDPLLPTDGDDPRSRAPIIELVSSADPLRPDQGPLTSTARFMHGAHAIAITVRGPSGTETSYDGGFLGVPEGGETFFSGIRRDLVEDSDDDTEVLLEASTVLVAFSLDLDLVSVSAALARMGVAPEDWFRELGIVRARVPGDPDRSVWRDVDDVRSRIVASEIADIAAGPVVVPNVMLEDESTLGEQLPTRLAAAYRPAGNADCTAAGTALMGCFDRGLEEGDPLLGFRYHFLYDTFAGHRLVTHLLRDVSTPERIGIAVVDSGFGEDGVNPSDIPAADFFGASSAPYGIGSGRGALKRINNVGRLECRDRANLPWAPCPATLGDVEDVSDHGTGVTVAAAGRGKVKIRNGSDVSLLGTSPNARVRVLRRSKGPTAFDSLAPIYAAAIDPEVHVINTSFGKKYPADQRGNLARELNGLTRNLTELVRDRGKIWVASAGNDRSCTDPLRARRPCGRNAKVHFPSDLAPGPGPRGPADPTILSVANSRTVGLLSRTESRQVIDVLAGSERLHGGSNYGPRVSVTAGGGDLVVLGNDGALDARFGTSFSAPTVAGLAAEMLHLNRNLPGVRRLSALQIIELIEATADDLGSRRRRPPFVNNQPANGRDAAFGHGRINVWKALLAVANGGLARESSDPAQFPSLGPAAENASTWFGLSVQSPVHDASLWLDGRPVQDPVTVRPTGNGVSRDLTAYKGVDSTRVVQRGVDVNGDGIADDDPTSGVVPVGAAAGEFIATLSLQRSDFRCDGRPCTLSLRRPGETVEDLPFFSIRLELDAMRQGRVPGVVFDDFVFEISATDFGDATPGRATRLLGENGARSLNATLEWFGSHPRSGVPAASIAVDGVGFEPNADLQLGGPDASVDPDGITNVLRASGRDGKDFGVMFFPRTYVPGGMGQVEFTICVAESGVRYDNLDDQSLWVNGWIDWNGQGGFEETAGEHVVDGLSILPRGRWRIRGSQQGPVATEGGCATYRRTFRVPNAIAASRLWARFRLDYGENVGRNDPRSGNTRRPGWQSDPRLRLAAGPTRFGEVEDYLIGTDYGDAPDPIEGGRYATRHANAGAHAFAFSREWLGDAADRAKASREIDACDVPRNAADQDPNLNLDAKCVGEDLDEEDAGLTIPDTVNPGQMIDVEITVASQIDIRGFSNRASGDPISADSANVLTLKENCRLDLIEDGPDTPERFRSSGRYAAWTTGRKRLFLSAWADWNADGDWDDPGEAVLDNRPVDPEDFGKDGRYTLGEPFDDVNQDGVFTEGVDGFVPAMHDVAGRTSRTFTCPVRVPDDVARDKTYYWRVRLAYGEGPAAVELNALRSIVHHAEQEPGQPRALAGPRGGSLWGEVEDHPQKATCIELDRAENARLELRIRRAGGEIETMALDGWWIWKVEVCDILDEDGDGFDEVVAHIAGWEMAGEDPCWGDLRAWLAPVDGNGVGRIEERVNRTPGVLDLEPFVTADDSVDETLGNTVVGGVASRDPMSAMARFEVAFDLDLGGERFRLPMIPIEEEIFFKPPRDPEERFEWRFEDGNDGDGRVMLLDAEGNPTEIELLGMTFAPAARAPMRANVAPDEVAPATVLPEEVVPND